MKNKRKRSKGVFSKLLIFASPAMVAVIVFWGVPTLYDSLALLFDWPCPMKFGYSYWRGRQREKEAAQFASVSADQTAKARFTAYGKSLGVQQSVTITIQSTIEKYTVKELPPKDPHFPGFIVIPHGNNFRSVNIEALVAQGLRSVEPSGKVWPADKPQLWESFSIVTNQTERMWIVQLEGCEASRGEGFIKLVIDEAEDSIEVKLPKVFPIFDKIVDYSRNNQTLQIGQYCMHPGEFFPRNDDYCGFRLLAITNQTVWFELLPGREAPPKKSVVRRVLWPNVTDLVDYRYDNGESEQWIKFGGGKVMKPGDRASFDGDGDSLLLDADSSGFVDPHTVRFHYTDPAHGVAVDVMAVIPRLRKR